jgi:hypothetical protein
MLLSASWQSFGSKVGRCQYRAVVQWAMGTLGVGTLAEGGRVKGRDRWGVGGGLGEGEGEVEGCC